MGLGRLGGGKGAEGRKGRGGEEGGEGTWSQLKTYLYIHISVNS